MLPEQLPLWFLTREMSFSANGLKLKLDRGFHVVFAWRPQQNSNNVC